MKIILTIILLVLPNISMAEYLIKNVNQNSGRVAFVEDNNESAWLYLTPLSGKGIEADAFLYSPIEPREKLNIKDIKNGQAPVLTKEVASEEAMKLGITDKNISFKWSTDGNSVVVFVNNAPFAFIGNDLKGYSKALSKSCPFGNPWDESKYREIKI